MRRIQVVLLLVSLCACFVACEAQAAVSDAAVLFLRIAPNARSAGMGEAFVAIADDASTSHWNPAGLGEYPLAHNWYQFKLTDDTRLRELAAQALQGKLAASFFEKFGTWQVKGNEISRFVDSSWVSTEQINIDSTRTVLANLSRMMTSIDKEKFKLAVRLVCQANTGVSFDEINGLRLQMLAVAGKDAVPTEKINSAIEKMVVFWQDLRFDAEKYAALKEMVAAAIADRSLANEELDGIAAAAAACETSSRTQQIKVPYPALLTVWQGWEVPWEQNIDKIAVMENGIPSDNYTHYDVWAVTNFGLARFDGSNWFDGDKVEPRKGDKLKDIVSRALGTADDNLINSRLEIVARANNSISKERLLEIRDQVLQALPAQFDNREELVKNLDGLEDAWLNCRLNQQKLDLFVSAFQKAYADSQLNESESDRLVFALEKSASDQLPRMIRFPFRAVVPGAINDIAVDRRMLYVATENGVYRYNGRSWEKFNTGSDSTTGAVWCVEVPKHDQVWLGCDAGIKVYKEGKWTIYGEGEGITVKPIKTIYVKNDKMAWAASEKDLYRFDGTAWVNTFKYTTTVSDSALSALSKAYGNIDVDKIKAEIARQQMTNRGLIGTMEPGKVITLPFEPLFEGRITALAMDNGNNLWVGTELGVKRYDGKVWTSYGYKAVKVEKEMTLDQLVREYLKTEDPDRISSFIALIKKKNTIQEGTLPAGRVVYIYSNPAGSPINALYDQGGKMYVASLYGTFSYSDGRWERYYHEGLNRANTKDIAGEAGEVWFATPDRVIIFAHGKKELSFTHANWLPDLAPDLYYEFLGYVHPVGSMGTLGANVTFLSYGTIVTTGETSSEATGTINPFDAAFTLSYGTRASKSLSVGLSAKVIYSRLSVVGAGQEVGRGEGTSFAAEAGLLYNFSKKMRLGMVVTNLGPNMSYIDAAQSDALPRNLAVGFAYRLVDSPYNRLTLVAEINKLLTSLGDGFSQEFREAVENFGMEYWYGSLLALRAGYIYDREGEIKTPTLGVGLQYKGKYRLDFAYIPSSQNTPLANTLRTSLTVKM
jgi:hypothetical protein